MISVIPLVFLTESHEHTQTHLSYDVSIDMLFQYLSDFLISGCHVCFWRVILFESLTFNVKMLYCMKLGTTELWPIQFSFEKHLKDYLKNVHGYQRHVLYAVRTHHYTFI